MFRVDQPIQSCSEDDLGRESFANAIAEAILNYDSKDSIVLGLFGPWGSGKTSILNCVQERVREISEALPESKKPEFILFNPWNYSDQNQLVGQFFKRVSCTLKISTFVENAKEIAGYLEKLSFVFRPVAHLIQAVDPGSGLAAQAGVEAMAAPAKILAACETEDSNDPEHIRMKLDKLLGKVQNKIIVVIDDIDRLNQVEIRQFSNLSRSWLISRIQSTFLLSTKMSY